MSEREPENNSLFGDKRPFHPIRRDEGKEEGILNTEKVVATLKPSIYALRTSDADDPVYVKAM
jgi:hypothetical protein